MVHGFDGGDGWDSGSGSGRSGGWYRGGGIVVEVTFSNGTTLVIGVVHFVALWWQVVVILTSVCTLVETLLSINTLTAVITSISPSVALVVDHSFVHTYISFACSTKAYIGILVRSGKGASHTCRNHNRNWCGGDAQLWWEGWGRGGVPVTVGDQTTGILWIRHQTTGAWQVVEDLALVCTGDESLGRFLTATISVTAIRPGLTLSVVYSLVATETCFRCDCYWNGLSRLLSWRNDWPGCGVLGVVTVWDPAALVEWVGDQLALRR